MKSLDLEISFTNGEVLFAVHKYTMEDGGAQDNQYREAKETLKQVHDSRGKVSVNLAAILDGDYYVKERSTRKTKLEQAQLEHPETIVCTYKNFESKTKTIWSRE